MQVYFNLGTVQYDVQYYTQIFELNLVQKSENIE